jgi:hypothetical protein
MTKQARWQRRQIALGRCRDCGQPRDKAGTEIRCRPCADKLKLARATRDEDVHGAPAVLDDDDHYEEQVLRRHDRRWGRA